MNEPQKRTLRRMLAELVVLLLLLPLQARAADYRCTAQLPVEVRTAGSATAEIFTVTLAAEDGAPPPDQEAVQVQGHGTASFTGLAYTAPGDYRYTVRQSAGTTAHMTYDATVYTVTVRVTNRADGSLGTEIWATGQTGGDKTGLLLFQNRYDPPSPTAAPTAAPTASPAVTTTRAAAAPRAPQPRRPGAGALPQTGDALPVTLLGVLALAGGTGFALTVGRAKRKK